MPRKPILPEVTVLLARLRAGASRADIANEYGVSVSAVGYKLRKAGYVERDWETDPVPVVKTKMRMVPEALLDTVASNDRVMRVQRAVLTRNFADVTNADIAFAVDAGWLPERFASDPLGLVS